MYVKFLVLTLALTVFGCTASYNGKKDEKYYQTIWCDKNKGKIEYVLDDSTRVDCLTKEYAVEVDWDYKWAEGVGQAQFYAEKTGKKAGLLLIIDNDSDRYIKRAEISGRCSGLKIWTIDK
jgi:hypothetical protein